MTRKSKEEKKVKAKSKPRKTNINVYLVNLMTYQERACKFRIMTTQSQKTTDSSFKLPTKHKTE